MYKRQLEEAEYCRKVMREGEIAQAVAENNIADATAKIDEISAVSYTHLDVYKRKHIPS